MSQESRVTRLTETVLTIQTLRKVMKRVKYDMEKGKRNRHEEEERRNINQRVQEEAEGIGWGEKTGNIEMSEGKDTNIDGEQRLREREGTHTDGEQGIREQEGTHMEEGNETKQENSRKENQWEDEMGNKREGKRGTLAKVKQKARWMMELIYRHGDVHRHPGPSTTSNRQEIGEQEKNRKMEQKVCETK